MQLKLNRHTLVVRKENYAEVVLLGDVHLGSPQCNVKKFLDMINYCVKKKIYVLLMGDLIELATRHSVGAGVYEQEYVGQSQVERAVEYLTPLSRAGLLLGSHNGNHEDRCYVLSGVNVAKWIARELGCPYLGDACWSKFTVEKPSTFNGARDKYTEYETYSMYSLHGRTGAKFDGTALLALERLAAPFHADIVAMGHSHKCISSAVMMQVRKKDQVVEHKKHLVITGHYLNYGGYAQTFGLPPSKLGSPKLKLFANRHDVHISW